MIPRPRGVPDWSCIGRSIHFGGEDGFMRYRAGLLSLLILLVSLGKATIDYTVSIDIPNGELDVIVDVPTKAETTLFQIPNWAPGSYVLANMRNGIINTAAKSDKGDVLTLTKVDDNTWSVNSSGTKSIQFSYSVKTQIQDDIAHYSGPSTYVYVVDRKLEDCRLNLVIPQDWKIAIGLNEKNERFIAPTYDVLADNPATIGKFREDKFFAVGKPITVAYRGAARNDVDLVAVRKVLKNIHETQAKLFGGLPYDKYIWHFSVNDRVDGGGGLEHLSSTQITLASGFGEGVQTVCSHEHFHAWNVKRIRSSVLGPFDYLQLPKTGALWWLEGVTDYYADLLYLRGGLGDRAFFYRSAVSNWDTTRRNPGRLQISPYMSSYRVGEANNGRGNSNGLLVSYYNTGWVLGLCLDIELRTRTQGRSSLDDVAKALWNLCKDNKPGFDEDEIRNQLIRAGGAEMGGIYDTWVTQPGDLPVDSQLAKMGLEIVEKQEPFADLGSAWRAVRADGGARVVRVTNSNLALKEGDIITMVDGVALPLANNKDLQLAIDKAASNAIVGKVIKFSVKRGTETLELECSPIQGTRTVRNVVEKSDSTNAQKAMRDAWLRRM